MALFGQIDMPSSGYNPARVTLDPNDPDYLRKLGMIGVMEGQHEVHAPNLKDQGGAPMTTGAMPTMAPTPPDPMAEYEAAKQRKPGVVSLMQKAEGIKSKPLRVLGEIGAGALTGLEAGGEAMFPAIAARIPGTFTQTGLMKERALTEGTELAKAQTEEERAKSEVAYQRMVGTAALERGEAAEVKAAKYEPPTGKETLGEFQAKLLEGMKSQTNPTTGKPYTDQELMLLAGRATNQIHDAFHEWLGSHPNGTYDQFLQDTTNLKRMGSVGYPLFLARLMNYAATVDPRAFQLVPHALTEMGIPAGMAEQFGTPPVGQPQAPGGAPLGLHQPGAPTTATRTAGQVADRVIVELPNVRQQITKLTPALGPAAGRIIVDFLSNKIGSTGNDELDTALGEFKTDLLFTSAASAKFHLNSVRAVEKFESAADAGKMTAAQIDGYLNAIERWAKDASKQGRGETIMPAETPTTPTGQRPPLSSFERP